MQKTVSRRAYIAIDLKSFYASVECIERGLDPLTTNLVVANPSRTEKTICLAVSPPLKSYGVPGRPRLFEVIQRIREVNEERRRRAPGRQFRDKSWRNDELKADPSLAVSYLVAPPRMAHYMKFCRFTDFTTFPAFLPSFSDAGPEIGLKPRNTRILRCIIRSKSASDIPLSRRRSARALRGGPCTYNPENVHGREVSG